MLIRWSLHAKHRFAERAAKYGINYGEIELEIKKQRAKAKLDKNKYKTIFKIADIILTAVKIETNDFIHVITLWEATEQEAKLWRSK